MSQDDGQSLAEENDGALEREPTVGERLRDAREAQPLSLAQISAELRIEPQFLTALEEDRLEDFPAPVFAKGYLKQYGILLGLDERDLLAQYYRQAKVRDVPVVHSKPIRLRDESQIRHWIAGSLVLLLLAGGAAAWWFTQSSNGSLPVTGPPVQPPPTAIAPAASAPSAEAAAAIDLDPPIVESVEVPADVGPSSQALVGVGPASAVEGAGGVLVELSFTEDCWTEISDARGERLFYGLGSAGARSRFSAMLPISIFFGNAGGVDLAVDGVPYPIPAGSRQGNLARFVIAEIGD